MKYSYSASRVGSPKRPIIEVELSRGRLTRKALGLIDSGADNIIMPAALATFFGIDEANCPRRPTMGINMSVIDGFLGELTVRLDRQMAAFNVSVVFINTEVPILLGRQGFFDGHVITFEQDEEMFEVSPTT